MVFNSMLCLPFVCRSCIWVGQLSSLMGMLILFAVLAHFKLSIFWSFPGFGVGDGALVLVVFDRFLDS